jgi:hypothetical protein
MNASAAALSTVCPECPLSPKTGPNGVGKRFQERILRLAAALGRFAHMTAARTFLIDSRPYDNVVTD